MTLSLDRYLENPVDLIREQLVLENGHPYGDVIQPWQQAFFEAVFAVQTEASFTERPDGRPKHRLIYDERRRGESKTEDAAAAALADLLTGPPRHRSFAVAASQDQATLLLDSVEGFKGRSPILQDIAVQRTWVRNDATGSVLQVLSADDRTAFGVRPRKVFFDELSLQPDDRLWLAMWSAVGKRIDAQMIALTMAGWDFASLAWQIRELARATLGYYFATRADTSPAPWLSPAQMEEQRATLHPADFSRFWECRWVEPRGSWITKEMYDAAEIGAETRLSDPSTRQVGFVDVGLVHDATAVAVCHLEGERVVLDTLKTLEGTREEPVQLEVLEDLVAELTRRYAVKRWVFESPQAVASVQRLQARLPVTVEARYPTAETQARLWGNLYRLFSTRRIVLYPHERLRKEALSLVTKTVGGRLKVVESSSIHQDHILAVGGAAELLDVETGSIPTAIFAGQRDDRGRLLTMPESELDGEGDEIWPASLFGPSIL